MPNVSEKDLLELVRERVVQHFQPIRLIVFGSRARGDSGPYSDIDLLVVLPHVEDKRQKAIEVRRLLKDLPVGKDIIVTTPEELSRRGDLVGTILRPALREGRVIFERG